ncbi:MAG: flavodoxin family protein, partial [Oscillospiraceae bacterium]|nr:flavodoxin family protein [Oscillospiraceae bacterium]
DRLTKYFTIANMVVVGSGYWNIVHGNTPEEVRQDLEGMQVMRRLGENMAYLLHSLEIANTSVTKNVPEPHIGMNFIR